MELLGVGAPVQHVQHRYRQRVRIGAAHGPEERDLQVVRHRLGASQRDGQRGVGPQPTLVGRPVQVDQREVDRPLVEGVQAAECTGDLAVDVGHRVLHALAPEAAAPVAELDCLTDAGRCPGGSDGTPAGAGVEQHLGFHGRVATRVENLAPDHVLNGAHQFSPSAPSLNGHRWKRLAVCPSWFGDALRCNDGVTQVHAALAQRVLGIDPQPLGQVRQHEETLAHRVVETGRIGRQGVVGTRFGLPRGLGQPFERRQSGSDLVRPRRLQADRARLASQLRRQHQGGQPQRDPFGHALAALLLALDLLPVGHHLGGLGGLDVAEHVRVPVDQLVVDAPGHPGQVELAFLPGQAGMEHDLKEQISSSSSRWT